MHDTTAGGQNGRVSYNMYQFHFSAMATKIHFGLLATDHYGNKQQANAIVGKGGTNATRLALEAVRPAQLLAYQRG